MLKREVGVAFSLFYQRRCAGYMRIRQTDKFHNSPQLWFGVFEKQIVMSNERFSAIRGLDQARVVNFPKPQAERIRGSVPLAHRVSDFQGVAHDDERFQSEEKIPPERER